MNLKGRLTVLIFGGFVLASVFLIKIDSPIHVLSQRIDLSPGDVFEFNLGENAMVLAVPDGPDESHSIGSFCIRQKSGPFDSGSLDRDGSVESLMVHDVNADGHPDAVIVLRSVGSGSYVSIVGLVSERAGYAIVHIPDPPATLLNGYMGHDTVLIKDDLIVRQFPTYIDQAGLRVDRQWEPNALTEQGELPVKVSTDSNAGPSGKDRELRYSVPQEQWFEQ